MDEAYWKNMQNPREISLYQLIEAEQRINA